MRSGRVARLWAVLVLCSGLHPSLPIREDESTRGKRGNRLKRVLALGAAVVIATLGLTIAPAAPAHAAVQATHNAVHGKRFVIDPGHASTCAGTHGTWTGQQEHDQVWEVANSAKIYLENLGAIVYFTKNSVGECPSVADRAAVTNSIAPNAFISIHRNAAGDALARGIETWYGFSNLSIYVNDAVVAEWGWPNRSVKTDCVNRSLPCSVNAPSGLVEIGFMTNYDEDTGHSAYADWQKSGLGIANGIYNFCLYNGCG